MQEATEKPVVVKEAVGVFNDEQTFLDAYDELLTSNFERSEISILASKEAVEKKLGRSYARVEELEDRTDVPTDPVPCPEGIAAAQGLIFGLPVYFAATAAVGAVLASGGTFLAALLAAAGAGAGAGMVGNVLAGILGKHHAQFLHEHIEKGGILLWVRTRDEEHERRAIDILKKHSAHDVHVHEIKAS